MAEEKICQEFRLKYKKETQHFIKEIDQNELMSKRHRRFCTILNYIEHFLILVLVVTGCISVSASAVGLKITSASKKETS